MIRLIGASATDAGRVRANNQDRIVVAEGRLYGVADGMGGHRGGEVAAEMVSDGLGAFVTRVLRTDPVAPTLNTEVITEEIAALNESLLERAGADEDLYGMGTTLTAIALSTAETPNGSEVVVAVFNIGDSRTYLLRNGELQQLTEDHSVVADLLRSGRITAEEAKTHRQRSVVTRALGVDTHVEIDVLEILPAPGMRYLMCSDGLTNELSDERIGSILRRLANPAEAARELVRLAVESGGRDNVSVVVVDVVDDAGYDEAALAASWDLDSTQVRAPSTLVADSVDSAESTVRIATGAKIAAPLPVPPKVRKPLPINIRVLAFLAILAVLGGIVFAVIKAAPDVEDPNTTVIVVGTDSTTLSGSTTTPSSSTDGSTIVLSESSTALSTGSVSLAPTVATVPTTIPPSQTTTSYDGFTETTIKATPSSNSKKKTQ